MLGNYLACTHRSQLEVEIERTPKAHFTTQQFIIKPGQQSTPSLFSRHCTVHFNNVTNTDDKFSITIDAAAHSAIVLTDKHFHGGARLHVKLTVLSLTCPLMTVIRRYFSCSFADQQSAAEIGPGLLSVAVTIRSRSPAFHSHLRATRVARGATLQRGDSRIPDSAQRATSNVSNADHGGHSTDRGSAHLCGDSSAGPCSAKLLPESAAPLAECPGAHSPLHRCPWPLPACVPLHQGVQSVGAGIASEVFGRWGPASSSDSISRVN
jgi:hypothetical protein